MNKFKKPTEYPAVSQPPAPVIAEKIIPQETKRTAWECVGCSDMAAVIHRGTGYCRTCYERRNYEGKLIG